MPSNTADILKSLESLGIKPETKSNEAMSSTQSSYGDEFVPTEMATQVIEKARAEETLFGLLPQSSIIDMPTNPYELPLEGGDPTFYLTSEQPNVTGTAVTTSKAGTSKVTLSAKKLSASVYLSGELDDDAKIAGGIQNYVTNKLGKAYAELLDKLMINGDDTTGATGNINSDDGAPTAGTYYLAFDGMYRHAIEASMTANAGTLASSDFLDVRKLLPARKHANPNKLLMVMEPETYIKTLQLAQVETAEKISGATIENGVLKSIYGIRIHVAPDFGKAEADGKQSATPSNNTLGRFFIVYTPNILFGWRRKMKITVKYLDEYDQFRITAHLRCAFDMAESDDVAAGINVTV